MQNFFFARLERSPNVRRLPGGYLPAISLFLILCAVGCLQPGCEVPSGTPEANLRDRVAAVYNKTGSVRNGERVIVLERLQSKRFVKVRSPRNEEGWVQERYLASQQTFDQLESLAAQYKDAPVQAVAVTRAPVNMHATPGRKTEHLYQLGGRPQCSASSHRAAEGREKRPEADRKRKTKTARSHFRVADR